MMCCFSNDTFIHTNTSYVFDFLMIRLEIEQSNKFCGLALCVESNLLRVKKIEGGIMAPTDTRLGARADKGEIF